MNSALPRQILGWLIMAPRLIETCNLSTNDFPAGRLRQAFETLSTIWENDRPEEEIPFSILSERIGGDGIADFLHTLLEGLQKPTAESFATVVRHMKRRGLSEKIVTAADRLGREHLKTGVFDDEGFSELQKLILKQGELENHTASFKSLSAQISLAERSAESVQVRAIPWLWHGVMPTHMATAITGDAGQGKSLVVGDMAARESRGTAFPIYDKPSPPSRGHVFYITSEGVPEMILVPRLMAAGADLSKITIIEGIHKRKDHFSMFDITRNLPDIERRSKDFPDLKLIIVDPIASFLPERINTNQGNQVRQAMDRVSELAFKLGIAIPTVMHFTKTPGQKAIHRTSGSVQFEASVKMSWSVIHREDDPRNVRLLVPQKSNITGGYKSLSFSIQPVEFTAPHDPAEVITTAKIVYGEHVDEDPETLISPPIEKDGDLPRAIEFLKLKIKAGGKLHSGEIIEEAKGEGIPYWSVNKARVRLGLKAAKSSEFTGGWFWYTEQKEKP